MEGAEGRCYLNDAGKMQKKKEAGIWRIWDRVARIILMERDYVFYIMEKKKS